LLLGHKKQQQIEWHSNHSNEPSFLALLSSSGPSFLALLSSSELSFEYSIQYQKSSS
jgi:hypothetical protein